MVGVVVTGSGGFHGTIGGGALEWQALGAWTFDAARARQVSVPVLFVSQQHAATVDTVRKWWPGMEFVELEGETHMFPFEAPALTAGTIVRFLARHRM